MLSFDEISLSIQNFQNVLLSVAKQPVRFYRYFDIRRISHLLNILFRLFWMRQSSAKITEVSSSDRLTLDWGDFEYFNVLSDS